MNISSMDWLMAHGSPKLAHEPNTNWLMAHLFASPIRGRK